MIEDISKQVLEARYEKIYPLKAIREESIPV